MECSLEILVSSYMSTRANLWKEIGDIIGNVFSFIAISLVVFVIPLIGLYIGIQEREILKGESFKIKFEDFYQGVRTHIWQSRVYALFYIIKKFLFLSIAFFFIDPAV